MRAEHFLYFNKATPPPPGGLGWCPFLGSGSVVVDFFVYCYSHCGNVIVRTMFCCTLLYVHFSFTIILMGKRELVALLSLSSWSLVMVVWLFLAVPWGCLRFVIVVFPDHTHLIFLSFSFTTFLD